MTDSVLRQRIITALVLAVIFIAALAARQPAVFALLGFVLIVVGGWEWSGLANVAAPTARLAYAALVAAAALLVAIIGSSDAMPNAHLLQWFLYGVSAFWLFMVYLVFRYPVASPLLYAPALRLLYGFIVLLAAWVGLLFLRFHAQGQFWIAISVALVATADTAAYFAGRRFGRRKLAAQVSPGKSWEGFWGGLLAAQLLGVVVYCVANLGGQGIPFLPWLIMVALLSSVSVLGDLTESMIKRIANCKDSGTIFPGHGGVLDRIDGLLPVLPLLSLFVLVLGG